MPITVTRTAGLELILRSLAQLATSAAYVAELGVAVANMNPGPIAGTLTDVNGNPFSLSLADTEDGGPAGWLGMTNTNTAPGFNHAVITTQVRLLPPYPMMLIMAKPGRPGELQEVLGKDWIYYIDCAAIVEVKKDPNEAEREALTMIDAFEKLVFRNYTLGGLVKEIFAPGPPFPGGVAQLQKTTLAAAAVRFEAVVIRLPN